jgi:hypothetical protein
VIWLRAIFHGTKFFLGVRLCPAARANRCGKKQSWWAHALDANRGKRDRRTVRVGPPDAWPMRRVRAVSVHCWKPQALHTHDENASPSLGCLERLPLLRRGNEGAWGSRLEFGREKRGS